MYPYRVRSDIIVPGRDILAQEGAQQLGLRGAAVHL